MGPARLGDQGKLKEITRGENVLGAAMVMEKPVMSSGFGGQVSQLVAKGCPVTGKKKGGGKFHT